jgi:hypothetical protein
MAYPVIPEPAGQALRTTVPEEFDLTPRLPEVPELPEPVLPTPPGEGDDPPRCRKECEELRDELRSKNGKSRLKICRLSLRIFNVGWKTAPSSTKMSQRKRSSGLNGTLRRSTSSSVRRATNSVPNGGA